MNKNHTAPSNKAIFVPEGHYLSSVGQNPHHIEFLAGKLNDNDQDGVLIAFQSDPFSQKPITVIGYMDRRAVGMPSESLEPMLKAFADYKGEITAWAVAQQGDNNAFVGLLKQLCVGFGIETPIVHKGRELAITVQSISLAPHHNSRGLHIVEPNLQERQDQEDHIHGSRQNDGLMLDLAACLDGRRRFGGGTIGQGVTSSQPMPMRAVSGGLPLNHQKFMTFYAG